MANTKRQIAENIKDYLANGTASSENIVDLRDIYIQLDRVTNKYAKLGLFENMQQGDRTASDCYITVFEGVKIILDPRREECYSILPARYINLPHGRGIDNVFPKGDRRNALDPLPRNFLSSFKFSHIKNKKGYFPEGPDKIIYTERYDKSGIEDADMKLVISGAEAISPDSVYPIDPAMEATIVAEVVSWFMPNEQRQQDEVTDNRRTL